MNLQSKFSPARRGFLAAGVATGVVGGIVAFSWSRGSLLRASWVEEVVRSHLPGVDLDAASLNTFVQDILNSHVLRTPNRKLSLVADRIVPWLIKHVPPIEVRLQTIERQVLTEYLIGSNFFRVADPKRETIVYYGLAKACPNPFKWPT